MFPNDEGHVERDARVGVCFNITRRVAVRGHDVPPQVIQQRGNKLRLVRAGGLIENQVKWEWEKQFK